MRKMPTSPTWFSSARRAPTLRSNSVTLSRPITWAASPGKVTLFPSTSLTLPCFPLTPRPAELSCGRRRSEDWTSSRIAVRLSTGLSCARLSLMLCGKIGEESEGSRLQSEDSGLFLFWLLCRLLYQRNGWHQIAIQSTNKKTSFSFY
jgi:hypothetical protein